MNLLDSEQIENNSKLFSANPQEVVVAIEAKRLQYAFMFDPLLAMSTSKVDPLPHQIEAVYKYLLKKPRIRFLFAHDPGAGKTIMAGLVIKELKLRGLINRILIVVPGHLKEQWRWEMEDRFHETFDVIDRQRYNELNSTNVWNGSQIITALDFAKRVDVLDSIDGVNFDLIIVDEAHKMSAYSTGRTTTKTQRYRLGETLSSVSKHLLFLTATPHKGDPANFRLLLDLLEPGYFSADGMIEDAIKNQDNPLFLRRAKESMVDFDGKPLFMPRQVHTPDLKLSPTERTLYNTLSNYVQKQYNLAMQATRGHNITFALIILQRRFASSTYALSESLKRRKARLEELERSATRITSDNVDVTTQMERVEEMSESERWDEEKKWELLSLAQNTKELRQEIEILDKLIQNASRVMKRKTETKLSQLQSTLRTLDQEQPNEKVLIFTEAKDTLDYLVSNIESWGYTVNTIHGAMTSNTRKEAEAIFRDRTRIMVATEAAGEGINLQFCHIMINYDLPWNPNRLEQRMGRIHRYGQKRDVHVFNLVAANTREGQIMQVLFDKLLEIKNAIGSDKVFDVISDIVPGKSLSQLLLDATVRSRSQKVIMRDLNRILDIDRHNAQNYLKDSLASKYMDQTILQERQESAREGQLVPHYTQSIFNDIIQLGQGDITNLGGGLVSITPPKDMKLEGAKTCPVATFQKQIRMANPKVDLITFGHPLFDSTLRWAARRYAGTANIGAVFTDPTGSLSGVVAFCEMSIKDGVGRLAGHTMTAYYVDLSGNVKEVPTAILLDLEPRGEIVEVPDMNKVQRLVLNAVKESQSKFTDTIQQDRSAQADTAQRYGIKSIDNMLATISDDIEVLLGKKTKRKKVDLAIYSKRKDRYRYRRAQRELKERIKKDSMLKSDTPCLIGIALVVPSTANTTQQYKQAVQLAMKHEKRRKRQPEETTAMGYGFNIRSVDAAKKSGDTPNTRYIISKVNTTNTITFTRNEWLRANMLGDDCYLYICKKGVSSGRIHELQNPAKVLAATRTECGYNIDISSVC